VDVIPWYELEYNCEVRRVGFITNDDDTCGCSPDGLLKDCGLEIKAPQAQNHVKYLLNNQLPPDYVAQVHFSMFVTGFEQWNFVSYRRNFPALHVRVERDENVMDTISTIMEAFIVRFEEGKARLIEINGGPPRRLTPMTPRTGPSRDVEKVMDKLNEIGITP